MINVNKTMHRREVTYCDWNISWDRLISVPIKLRPVTLMELVFIDGRVKRVETQLPLRMRFQILKYME